MGTGWEVTVVTQGSGRALGPRQELWREREVDGAGYIGEYSCEDLLRDWMWTGREGTGATPMFSVLKSDCWGRKPKPLN